MKPLFLLAAPMGAPLMERLAERVELIGPFDATLHAALADLPAATRARVSAALSIGTVAFTADAMDQLPALRLIACLGSGFEGVDLEAAGARGIAVTHSPAVNAPSVADLAIGLMIESVRQMPAARRRLSSGTWKGNTGERSMPVRGLTGRRLGIYGLGAIGTRIAARASAMEMEIAYHNRQRRWSAPYPYFDSLLALAQWSDVLMVAVRAGPANRHAVNAEVLAALGTDGHVVNIARGSVIDESALIVALERGVIAGAGLDVFEHEPNVPAALLALPIVALSPHIGGNTFEAHAAMEACVLANVDAFLAGRTLPTPISGG